MNADKVIKFIENLTLTDEYSGQPFKLRPWQKSIIVTIYNPDKKNIFILIPRKNSKTTLLAGIVLAQLLLGPDGQEIISAGANRDQASIIFKKCKQMVEADITLRRLVKIYRNTKQLVYKNSTYTAISHEGKTHHGKNPSMVIADEVAQYPDRELWNTLTSGSGTRKDNYKIIAITTAGTFDDTSLVWHLFQHSLKVKAQPELDPNHDSILYHCDEEKEDWKDEKVWHRCNPALSDFLSIKTMREEFNKAILYKDEEVKFKTLYLNIFCNPISKAIDMNDWDLCCKEGSQAGLCWAGLDIGLVDMTAFVLLFQDYSVLPFFFVPRKVIKEREEKNLVRYDSWAERGYIELTDGDIIDYPYILKRIKEIGQQYNIEEIAYDPREATQLALQLDSEGFNMIRYGQGYAEMNEPTKQLLTLVKTHQIKCNSPVMRWNASNLQIKSNPFDGTVRPSKEYKSSPDKVDGIVALIMSLGRMMQKPGESQYENTGLLAI